VLCPCWIWRRSRPRRLLVVQRVPLRQRHDPWRRRLGLSFVTVNEHPRQRAAGQLARCLVHQRGGHGPRVRVDPRASSADHWPISPGCSARSSRSSVRQSATRPRTAAGRSQSATPSTARWSRTGRLTASPSRRCAIAVLDRAGLASVRREGRRQPRRPPRSTTSPVASIGRTRSTPTGRSTTSSRAWNAIGRPFGGCFELSATRSSGDH
jgi:hypothetical protein